MRTKILGVVASCMLALSAGQVKANTIFDATLTFVVGNFPQPYPTGWLASFPYPFPSPVVLNGTIDMQGVQAGNEFSVDL